MKEILLSDMYNMPSEQMGAMSLLGIEKAFLTDESFAVVMKAEDIHLNTQGIVHGGILFTLCDQAVGAYLVYKKRKGVAMDGNIHYYCPAQKGEILTATVFERKQGKQIGVYFVELRNQNDKLLADGFFTAMYSNEILG